MTRRVFWALCVCALLLPGRGRGTDRRDLCRQQAQPLGDRPGPVKSFHRDRDLRLLPHPHNANPAVPLWNQTLSTGATYQPYASTTMKATVGLPTGSSKLCLACHDGTVAIGNTIQQRADRDAGRERAGHADRAVGARDGPPARSSDLVRPVTAARS